MKQAVKRILIPLFILFTGCDADFDFDQPRVVSITPSHNSTLVPAGSIVVVNFSKPMDTVKTNNEFSLSGDAGKIEGYFAWENGDKRMVFTPGGNYTASDKFTVRITTGAEDKDGNDLKDESVSVFYINGETGSPYVTASAPVPDSIGNPRNSTIVITFSEPVDLNSIYRGISISPSIQGVFSWNAGVTDSNIITFTPLYGFNFGVTYSVTIGDSIIDASGNKLREPLTFNFTVGDDFVKPQLTVYQDTLPVLNFDEALIIHGAEKDKRIVLTFSEIISADNLRSAISISPSAGFYVSSETAGGVTTGYINFTEILFPEETYTLRISSSITDLQNNPLVKDYRYVFVTDGTGSIAPVVKEIGDLNPVIPRWDKDDIEMLLLQALPLDPLLYPDIVVDFNNEIDPLSLSIFAVTAAGTGGSPSIINIDWPDIPPAPAVRFMRLRFGLYNVNAGNIYKIVIKGGKSGLRDMHGNYMKEDFVQMIRF
jgi:hypothetical protein